MSVQGALGGLSLAFALMTVVRSIASFERAMSSVAAVSGATGETFDRMTAKARQMGATTMFTATEAAEGMTFLAMAGFTAEQTVAAIEPSLQLAQAGMLDLATAADIASNVLSTFMLPAQETSKVGDIMATTAARANTNIRQMAEAIKFAGPMAAATGQDLGELSATIGVLGNAGLQGSTAGTGLRMMMLGLAAPTGTARKALRDLGADMSKLNPETNNLITILEELKRVQLGVGDAAQIFGARGANTVLVLTQNLDKVKELNGEIQAGEGNLKKMADEMANNLYGSIKALESAMQELIFAVGDEGLAGGLRSVVDFLTGFVRALNNTLDFTTEGAEAMYIFADAVKIFGVALAAVGIAKFGAAIVTMLIPLYSAIVGVTSATSAMAAFNVVLLANPLTAVAALLGIAAGAFMVFGGNGRTAAEMTDKFNKAINDSRLAMYQYEAAVGSATEALADFNYENLEFSRIQLNQQLADEKKAFEEYEREVYLASQTLLSYLGVAQDIRLLSGQAEPLLGNFDEATELIRLTEAGNTAAVALANLFKQYDRGEISVTEYVVAMDKLQASTGRGNKQLEVTVQRLSPVASSAKDASDRITELEDALNQVGQMIAGTWSPMEETANATNRMGDASLLTADAIKILREELVRLVGLTQESADEVNALADSLGVFERQTEDMGKTTLQRAQEKLKADYDALVLAGEELGANAEFFARAKSAFDTAWQRMKKNVSTDATPKVSDFDRVFESLSNSLEIAQQTDELAKEIAKNLQDAGFKLDDEGEQAAMIRQLTIDTFNLTEAERDRRDELNKTLTSEEEAKESLDKYRSSFALLIGDYEAGGMSLNEFRKKQAGLLDDSERSQFLLDATRAALETLRTEQDKVTDAVRTYDDLLKDHLITQEQHDELVRRTNPVYEIARAYLEGQTQALRDATEEMDAFTQLYDSGAISAELFAQKIHEGNIALLELKIAAGEGDFADGFMLSLQRMTEGVENWKSNAGAAFGDFFQSFTDGFADAFGRAIVYSENLGEAMQNVAREALSALISALVKMGIQMAVNAIIGNTLGAAATATSVAQAAIVATAWAPAATLASLASFGTNSVPAIAGMGAAAAFAKGLAAMSGFADGGYVTGPGGPKEDKILAKLSAGEFVMNAGATSANRPMLEAMNKGVINGSRSGDSVSSSGSGGGGGVMIGAINTKVDIQITSSGNAEDDERLAKRVSKEITNKQRDMTRSVILAELRAGGLLSKTGKFANG